MTTGTEGERTSRFAEIAMELYGTRMAAEFMKDVWQNASSEVKAELAATVIQAVKDRFKSEAFKWNVEQTIDAEARRFLAEIVKTEVAKDAEALESKANKALDTRWETAVEAAVRERVDAILREVSAKLRHTV